MGAYSMPCRSAAAAVEPCDRLSHTNIKDWVHDRLSHTNVKDWVHDRLLRQSVLHRGP
jgi:hypothetical protein